MGQKSSFLSKLFCLGDFGAEKNQRGAQLSQKTDSGKNPQRGDNAKIVTDFDVRVTAVFIHFLKFLISG